MTSPGDQSAIELEEIEAIKRLPPELVGAVLGAAEGRRNQNDQLMWQIPALTLTAQAFLATVSLGAGTSNVGRFMAALIALTFATAAFQQMLKHRIDEGKWSRWLERYEASLGLPELHGKPARSDAFALHNGDPCWDPEERSRWFSSYVFLLRKRSGAKERWFGGSAFQIWACALFCTLLFDVVVLGLAVANWAGANIF